MNGTTREIAAKFGIELSEATQVQYILECCIGIDYSEATQGELNRSMKEAFDWYQQDGFCCPPITN